MGHHIHGIFPFFPPVHSDWHSPPPTSELPYITCVQPQPRTQAGRVKSIPVHHSSPTLAVCKLKKSGEILQPSKDSSHHPLYNFLRFPGVGRRLTSWHYQLQTRRWIHTLIESLLTKGLRNPTGRVKFVYILITRVYILMLICTNTSGYISCIFINMSVCVLL